MNARIPFDRTTPTLRREHGAIDYRAGKPALSRDPDYLRGRELAAMPAPEPETPHPAAGCTPAQRFAFEQIATGVTTGHNTRVLKALAGKGLIELRRRSLGRTLPLVVIDEPFVPIGLHMQFCQWASEQPEDEFEADLHT